MNDSNLRRALLFHLGVIVLLFASQFILPAYHHTNFARIMVLASYAIGYNILVGYTGLMSLGHAMFFAAGLYGAGLTIHYLGVSPPAAFLIGVLAATGLAVAVSLVALRTSGVSFMIVTMMLAQACYLLTLYLNRFTRGDEGIALRPEARRGVFAGLPFDLSDPTIRFNLALLLFAICMFGAFALVRSEFGRVLVAVRENEERTRLLGYDTNRYKRLALAASGAMAGAAGAAYVLLFSYMGSTFAAIEYSILPLLWVLLGGAGTVAGPFIGTLLMFYLAEFSGDFANEHDLNGLDKLIVGLVLVLLVLFFPKGIAGSLRERYAPWLP
jgi:branched-chain amino acid transport system permease protein